MCACIAISLTAFQLSLERKHALAKVVFCLIGFALVEVIPVWSIVRQFALFVCNNLFLVEAFLCRSGKAYIAADSASGRKEANIAEGLFHLPRSPVVCLFHYNKVPVSTKYIACPVNFVVMEFNSSTF